MSPQSLVFSKELSQLLTEKGVEVETCFKWRSPMPQLGFKEWSVADVEIAHGAENIFAPTLSEAPEVFRKLGEILKWGKRQESCMTCFKAGFAAPVGGCENCPSFWLEHYLTFCRLWAESKEKGEEYLFSILK